MYLDTNREIVFIDKEHILSNFLNMCDYIKKENIVCTSDFGFYFEDGFIIVDLIDDGFGLDKIIDYIKYRNFDDLIYYFFITKYDNPEYVYCRDESFRNISTYEASFKLERFDYNDRNLLLTIDKDWYERDE